MSPSSRLGPVILLVLVVAMTALAGCGKPQAATPIDKVEQALQHTSGKVLHGRVLTDEIMPLAEATVELLDDQTNVTTDPEGGYLLAGLESRDYLVKVTSPGYYPEVQRAAMMLGRDFKLDFYLVKMPTGDPERTTQVFNAFLSCQATVRTDFPGTMRQDCGSADPNNARTTQFAFGPHSTGFVLEFDWEPTTPCAATLDFGLYLLMDGGPVHALHESSIVPGQRIQVPPAYFAPKGKVGGEVSAILNGEPCNVGGPGFGGGVVLQQPVTVHFTAFYFETIPPGFSVKNG